MSGREGREPALPPAQRALLAVGFCTLLVFVLWMTSGVFRGGGPEAAPTDCRLTAPEFELPLLSGDTFRLADHRGKTVILDFWATWCSPCEVQMPVLDTLHQARTGASARGGPELVVVGISVDTDPAAKVEAWIEERGIGYPIALGSTALAQQYGAIGFPSLYIVDPAGRIHTHHTGVLSRPELEDLLNAIAIEQEGLN